MTIGAAVSAASSGDTIIVAGGIYTEQVVVNSLNNLTIQAATGATVTVLAPITLAQTATSTSGRAIDGIITVNNSSNVVVSNINVDGGGRGNGVVGTNADFVGVEYRNSSGGLTNVGVTGVHDAYPGGTTPGGEPIQSGVQRGEGVEVDNDTTLAFFMHGGTVHDFQKNGTIFNHANLDVSGVTVAGGGAQSIIAQNGIEALNSTGNISGNTVTGIGYAGPADAYSGAVLAFDNTNLNIQNNSISGSNNQSTNAKVVGIFVYDAETGGTISGNTISNVDTGVGVYDNATGLTINNNTVTNVDLTDPYAAHLDIEANAGAAFSGTAGSEILIGGAANDQITGGGGNDSIVGGGGTDTAVYTSTLSAANFSYDTVNHQWVVTSGSEGADHLSMISKATDGAGHTFWLVDAGDSITSIQAAINAASAGDTILIAGGSYSESAVPTEASGTAGGLYINKAVTLQGFSSLDGSMVTSASAAKQYGPTIVSAAQTDFGSNHFVGVAGAGTVINGVHLKAGESTNNKLLEIWGDNVNVTNSYLDVNAASAGYTGAVAVYFNDNGSSSTDNITKYKIDQNILNEGIIVANGVGDPSLGTGANQKITNNTFEGHFDLSTGVDRYDGIVVNGQVSGIAWLLEPTQTPTITGNSFGDNSTPFLLRGSDNSAANLPSAAQVASVLAANGDNNTRYAYVLQSGGALRLADRNDGSGPYKSFAVTNTLDTLNLALDTTADNVFGGQRNYILSGDTVVVQSGDAGTLNSSVMVDNLTVKASGHSADLNLTLATQFADGSAISGGGVANLMLGDYALNAGANVDVVGNALDNVITGNSGNNNISGDGGSDTFSGGKGDDIFNGGSGNDVTDGGGGLDKAIFSGARSSYTITQSAASTTVLGPEGSDTFTNLEQLVFTDQTVVVRASPARDFDGGGASDILWRNTNGQADIWLMNGTSIISAADVGGNPGNSWQLKSTGDFNGDGRGDILWQNTNGQADVWLLSGTGVLSANDVGSNPGTAWQIKSAGDFNGDGKSDILWQNTNGQADIWLLNGTSVVSAADVGGNPGTAWQIKGTGDFNGDGKSDILWQNTNGQADIWLMNGTSVIGAADVGGNPGTAWQIKATGDFNGDGKSDILWQNTNGQADIWLLNGTTVLSAADVGANPGTAWQVKNAGDFNNDGKSDIIWQNTNGQADIWLMSGTTVLSAADVGANPGTSWQIAVGS